VLSGSLLAHMCTSLWRTWMSKLLANSKINFAEIVISRVGDNILWSTILWRGSTTVEWSMVAGVSPMTEKCVCVEGYSWVVVAGGRLRERSGKACSHRIGRVSPTFSARASRRRVDSD
jgi:hypothetical protein